MAELLNSLETINKGLAPLSDYNGKFLTLSNLDGEVVGRCRPNLILYQDELVDMGLPSGTLWAKKNLGATSETGWGWYFSWGNIDPHQEGAGYDFSDATYANTDGAALTSNITAANDAATQNLGSKWRLPTEADFVELFSSDYTTNAWTTVNSVAGRLVTSKANGNTLFFPAAGDYSGTSLYYRGSNGLYWSSTWISATDARHSYFNSSGVNPQYSYSRRYGFSVRAVQ